MPEEIASRANFAQMLNEEVGQILTDPVFERSPVLSRLLTFLEEETTKNARPRITQFSIAVDGLGKEDNFDLSAESYPRVQVTRLRKALREYYSRVQPVSGLCVFIRNADYALRLATIEKAYPELLDGRYGYRQSAAPESPPPPEPAAFNAPPGRENVAEARQSPISPTVAVLALVAMGAAALAYFFLRPETPQIHTSPPTLTTEVHWTDGNHTVPERQRLAEEIHGRLENLISSSMAVSNTSTEGYYKLEVSLVSDETGKREAFLNLKVNGDWTIFSRAIASTAPDDAFARDIELQAKRIVSPAGLIAGDIVGKLQSKPQSGFECFIAIEIQKSRMQDTAPLIDECLRRHGSSPYSTYFHARKADVALSQEMIASGEITENGEGEVELRKAFAQDPNNSIANLIAAKLALAQGDCDKAAGYLRTAYDRGRTYPALIASALVDYPVCKEAIDAQIDVPRLLDQYDHNFSGQARELTYYLTLADIASGDITEASLHVPDAATASLEKLSEAEKLIYGALQDRDMARSQRDRIDAALRQHVWNAANRQRLMQSLTSR